MLLEQPIAFNTGIMARDLQKFDVNTEANNIEKPGDQIEIPGN